MLLWLCYAENYDSFILFYYYIFLNSFYSSYYICSHHSTSTTYVAIVLYGPCCLTVNFHVIFLQKYSVRFFLINNISKIHQLSIVKRSCMCYACIIPKIQHDIQLRKDFKQVVEQLCGKIRRNVQSVIKAVNSM